MGYKSQSNLDFSKFLLDFVQQAKFIGECFPVYVSSSVPMNCSACIIFQINGLCNLIASLIWIFNTVTNVTAKQS